jgi:hypothetical protein
MIAVRHPITEASASQVERNKMINRPNVDANDYLDEDSIDIAPKHGTTVQAGWGAAEAYLKPKTVESKFATDFKFSEQATLVRFLEDEPFMVYEQHWIDRTEGRRSFVCLGAECPLCTIADDKPRAKFAFNVLVLSDEEPNVQVLTAVPTLARLLKAANDDARRGPLSKHYWTISRLGTGRDTQYALERVRAADLAEEWELDAEKIDSIASKAIRYDSSAVYISPREELLTVARSIA